MPLKYKDIEMEVGYRAGFIIEDKLLLELKTVDALLPVHTAQVITCLRLKKYPMGLLINFNEALIKNGIHRILNVPRSENEVIT